MNKINPDLLIIGAGPGGYEAALKAASKGLNVVLVDKERVGGTCLNYGCIPTKAYYHSAKLLHQLETIDEFGITLGDYSFNYLNIKNRKDQIVDELVGNIEKLLCSKNVTLYKGLATFINDEEVMIETLDSKTIVQAKNIIIATGSKPNVVKITGIEHAITSKELLDISNLPQSLVIIGGGVIGVEFASIMNAYGVDVTLVEATSNLIPLVDHDISKRLKVYLKNKGITIYTDTLVNEIGKCEDGNYTVRLKGKKKDIEMNTELVLNATGRIPHLDSLGLDTTSIQYTPKGILVNSNFQTNLEHVYAIGDCNGISMLAHSATYQGYKVIDLLTNVENHTNFELVPSCIFTFPEVATVGLSEEQAKEIHSNVLTAKHLYTASGKAKCLGETDGFVKVVVVDECIMGVSIIGAHASDLIGEATILVQQKMSIHNFKDIIHAHPTLPEIISECIHKMI